MWWENAVIYQVYPRSFQDSDGDGVGDLRGIAARLDHLKWLGVDALWMSPIYPSPMADFGYDVSDFEGVDPVFGTLADYDALVGRAARPRAAAAHGPGAVPHVDRAPLVRRAPRLVRVDRPAQQLALARSAAPPGSAWADRFYLHSFYPEQPDLDWRNPEVVRAMQGVLRFWLERGADGFRLDALDRLMKDPRAARRPAGHGALRRCLSPSSWPTSRPCTRGTRRTSARRSAAIREAAGDALLVGEVYLPARALGAVPRAPGPAFALRAAALAMGGRARCARRSPAARARRTAPPG